MKASKSIEQPEDVEVNWCLSVIFLFDLNILSVSLITNYIYLICVSNIMQPTEMSLEEIESRIGSLIQSDTIALLKSAVWKERLEGWQSVFLVIVCCCLYEVLDKIRSLKLDFCSHFFTETAGRRLTGPQPISRNFDSFTLHFTWMGREKCSGSKILSLEFKMFYSWWFVVKHREEILRGP